MKIDRNKLIGERVRYYRTARDISMEKLAKELPTIHITPQQLARYETALSRWPADLLCEVAAAMRLDIRLLAGMEDGKHEGKDTDEWEAERHKIMLLKLGPKAREIAYKLIAGILSMEKKS